MSSFQESTGAPPDCAGLMTHALIERRKYGSSTGSLTSSGMALSILPAASTFTQYFTVNGPLYESADHGVFCGIGVVSTWSIGVDPSAGGGTFRLVEPLGVGRPFERLRKRRGRAGPA